MKKIIILSLFALRSFACEITTSELNHPQLGRLVKISVQNNFKSILESYVPIEDFENGKRSGSLNYHQRSNYLDSLNYIIKINFNEKSEIKFASLSRFDPAAIIWDSSRKKVKCSK